MVHIVVVRVCNKFATVPLINGAGMDAIGMTSIYLSSAGILARLLNSNHGSYTSPQPVPILARVCSVNPAPVCDQLIRLGIGLSITQERS
jgi:hypothetical protein